MFDGFRFMIRDLIESRRHKRSAVVPRPTDQQKEFVGIIPYLRMREAHGWFDPTPFQQKTEDAEFEIIEPKQLTDKTNTDEQANGTT